MEIFLNDYLYCGDDTLAVSEALRNCRDGDTLHLCGQTLVFEQQFAEPKNYYLPRYSDKTKYYAVYAEDKKNITIDGDGATLYFKGDVSGFGLENCEGLTLKNFSIDTVFPWYWQAKITSSNDEYFEVEFDEKKFPCKYDAENKILKFIVHNGEFSWNSGSLLANEFSPVTKGMVPDSPDYFLCTDGPDPVYGSMSVMVETEVLDSNKFRFRFKNRSVKHTVGNYLVVSNHERRNTNIHLHHCKDIVLENIDMHGSASFGVIALLCENIRIKNVNSILKPDSDGLMAVLADMFHCVNCRGMIDIGYCTIENAKDDSINVHTLMAEVVQVLDRHTLIAKIPYLAKRALNLFRSGEKLHCLTKEFYERGREITVRSSELLGQYHLRLELEDEIDDTILNMLLESTDAMPKVCLHDCKSGNNRGRGFLVTSSEKTVIENNTFYNNSCGVSIGGASARYAEGGAVEDFTIRGNHFLQKKCAIRINPTSIVAERTEAYHKNICIEHNTFCASPEDFCEIRLADAVKIENNQFHCCEK